MSGTQYRIRLTPVVGEPETHSLASSYTLVQVQALVDRATDERGELLLLREDNTPLLVDVSAWRTIAVAPVGR